MKFDIKAMVENAQELAKLKKVPFRWCCDDYPKPVRSHGPDRAALVASAPFLHLLVDAAPNGYPSHTDLRAVLMCLDDDHQILENAISEKNPKGKTQFEAANLSADIWRKKTKDLLYIKKNSCRLTDIQLRALVDKMVPTGVPSASDDGSGTANGDNGDNGDNGGGNGEAAPDMHPPGDDEVEVIRMTCRCPECEPSMVDLSSLNPMSPAETVRARSPTPPVRATDHRRAGLPSPSQSRTPVVAADAVVVDAAGTPRHTDQNGGRPKRQRLLLRNDSCDSQLLTEVPNAGKAGQKPETLPDEEAGEVDGKATTQPRKRIRMRQKTAGSNKVAMKRPAGTQSKQTMYKTCRLEDPLPAGPFSLRWRTSPPMGYVMGPKYVVGLAKSRSSMYAEILQDVCKLLNGKEFASKKALYDWVNNACSDDEE